LRKVVNDLVKIGFVKSTRGRHGGLRLGRPPAQIPVGAAIRSPERDFTLVDCFGETPKRCAIAGSCGLQGIFRIALDAWFEVLDQYTLADVARGAPELPHSRRIAETKDRSQDETVTLHLQDAQRQPQTPRP